MYLFAIFEKRFTLKEGYHYMKNHWLDWFPAMPSYQAYNYRLNQLYWQLEVIIGELMRKVPYQGLLPGYFPRGLFTYYSFQKALSSQSGPASS
jgi:hypothetical protein